MESTRNTMARVHIEPRVLNLTCEDQTATLRCFAEDVAVLQYRWKLGDRPLNKTDIRYDQNFGELIIKDVQSTQEVKYTCEVYNGTQEIGQATATLLHPDECVTDTSSALGAGQITAIVLGVVIGVTIVALIILLAVKRTRKGIVSFCRRICRSDTPKNEPDNESEQETIALRSGENTDAEQHTTTVANDQNAINDTLQASETARAERNEEIEENVAGGEQEPLPVERSDSQANVDHDQRHPLARSIDAQPENQQGMDTGTNPSDIPVRPPENGGYNDNRSGSQKKENSPNTQIQSSESVEGQALTT